MKVEKLIKKIVEKGKQEDMEKLSDMLECLIKKSHNEVGFKIELYTILNGYHFDDCTLEYALEMIGGQKITCEDIERKLKMYGLSIPQDITIQDVSYALHMFYSDYSEMGLNESQALEWSVLYVTDPDFPIKNGKCFAEWSHKMCLLKEHK